MVIKILFLIILLIILNNIGIDLEYFDNKSWDAAYYITLPRLKERQKYMIDQFKNKYLYPAFKTIINTLDSSCCKSSLSTIIFSSSSRLCLRV